MGFGGKKEQRIVVTIYVIWCLCVLCGQAFDADALNLYTSHRKSSHSRFNTYR